MRVALVTVDDPWRVDHGGTLRTKAFARACLDLGHSVTSVHLAEDDVAPPAVPPLAPPAGVSTIPIAATLSSDRLPESVRRLKRWLLPLPTVAGGRIPALSSALRALPSHDVLLVQQLRTAPYVADLPGSRLWLDQTDLMSTFLVAESRVRRFPASWTARGQQLASTLAEVAWARRAAALTAAGWSDAGVLRQRARRAVSWLPTPVQAAALPPRTRGAVDRPVAGLFANFAFWPNIDAYSLLVDFWAPRLAEVGWDVIVAGLGSLELAPDDRVSAVGPMARPADFYQQVDVALVPVRLGSGIKVKVHEALSYGRPVVAVDEALRGLPPALRVHIPTVDATNPDFSRLANGPPDFEPDIWPLLSPFSQSHFTGVVERVLATLAHDAGT